MNVEAPDCAHCQSRHSSLFHFCHLEEMGKISDVKSHTAFKKGQVIFQEGSNAIGLYCVNSGHIKIHKSAPDGHEQIIRISKPGDFLGYSSLLANTRYAASATTLEDSVVCLIPKAEIFKLFKENNRFAEGMIEMIGKSLQSSYEMMANLPYKPVRGRMAEALLLLYNTFKDDNNPSGEIQISRDDLASIVGTVKETAIRTLKDFKDSKLIETEGSSISVLNPQGLAKVSELYD
jgi:CRP-like cAMP-binding protein